MGWRWIGCLSILAACTSAPVAVSADEDADGYLAADDCDDHDRNSFPGNPETCDGADNDCDGEIDEQVADRPAWFADEDADGFGNPNQVRYACEAPDAGWVKDGTDCDDARAASHPTAPEWCNAIDDDCDGLVDDDPEDGDVYYPDADADGFGDGDAPVRACEKPARHQLDGSDCDDTRAWINPARPELCDAADLDEDCDGLSDDDDEAPLDPTPWYADADADGFGNPDAVELRCDPLPDEVGDATDCDDARDDVHPGMTEICDNDRDDDCSGGAPECGLEGWFTSGDADEALVGEASADAAGYALAAGDVDGDGSGDLIVGAPQHDTPRGDSGMVYLVTSPLGASGGLRTAAVARYSGFNADERVGSSVAFAGDLDGDGYGDVVVGAPGFGSGAGAVYVMGGPHSGYSTIRDAAVAIAGGSSGDLIGWAVAVPGDVTGDGIADLVIGAPGRSNGSNADGGAYVVSGDETGSVDVDEVALRLDGPADDGLEAGTAVAGADLDGDGAGDVVVGAPDGDGVVYVVLGPLEADVYLEDADAVLSGSGGERAGEALACVDDLDGDGTADLLIGAPYRTDSGAAVGAAYLLLGAPSTGELADADLRIDGPAGHASYLGNALAGGHDVDGDGDGDLLLGASRDSSGSGLAGAAYLFTAIPTGTLTAADAAGVVYGSAVGDRLGRAVTLVPDVDGDGYADVALGAADASNGEVYLVLGGPGF